MNQRTSHKALLWIVAVGFFMQTLDATIVNTALPAIARQLHASPLAMHTVVIAYTLTMALLTPASGWLADRFGTRTVYSMSIMLFTVGSLACANSHSVHQLVSARVVQGLGASMLLPIGRMAVLRRISGEQYIAALAMIAIAGQVGPILGPALGGFLSEALSWNWIFLVNLPIGAVGMVGAWRFLQDDALPMIETFDVVGFGLISLSMVAFTLGADVPVSTHREAWAAGSLALSIIAALTYIPYARTHTRPLFKLSLFRERNLSLGLAGNLVCVVGTSAVPFLLPLLFQLQMGYSPFRSGLMLLPAAIAGAFTKRNVVPLIKRYGYSTFLLVNTLTMGTSIVGLATIDHGSPIIITFLLLAVFGASNSMQFAAVLGVMMKGLPASQAGSGNSLLSMTQMLSVGLGVAVSSSLLRTFSGGVHSTLNGFRITFAIVGTITLLSTIMFRRIIEVRQNPQTAGAQDIPVGR